MSLYGMIRGESAADYHESDGVSSHRLADFAKPNVPLLYYRKYVTKESANDERTKALAFGEYFHCLALEGEAVADSRFAIPPHKIDRRTKEGKAEWAKFEEACAGRQHVAQEDADLAWRMVNAIREKPGIAKLFSSGSPEVTFRHRMASFDIRCRVDWFDETLDEWKRPLIIDVKTIDRLADFDRQFLRFGYWRQAAFYQLVVYQTLKLTGAFPLFKFVVVEKEEPFQAKVFSPDEITLDHARRCVMADLRRLKQCYDTNHWPGEADEESAISLPDYMLSMPTE